LYTYVALDIFSSALEVCDDALHFAASSGENTDGKVNERFKSAAQALDKYGQHLLVK
jgi:hypothetical protein